jgi:CNT family concentrative nucleoside transporter
MQQFIGVLGLIIIVGMCWTLSENRRRIAWRTVILGVGQLLGKKLVLNEFVAYLDLAKMGDQLSERSRVIISYALCGFANFSSIAIQLGGTGSLVPERRGDIARFGMKALLGGTLATCMTAAIVGLLI